MICVSRSIRAARISARCARSEYSSVRAVLALDPQCHVNGMFGRGYGAPATPVRERVCAGNRSRGRIYPIGLVSAGRQVENEVLFVSSGYHLIHIWFELAVMVVEGILLP